MNGDGTIKPSELDDIRKRLSELMALSTASVMRIEALRKTLDAKALAEYEKHLAELERRWAGIVAKRSSQSLSKMLAEFEGTKQ